MIEPQELRIGNYIMFEKTTHIVVELSETLISTRWIKGSDKYIHTISEITPIPLTKDILLKCGFKLTRQYLSGFTGRLPRVLVKDNIVYNSGGFFGGSNESECDKPGISIARDRICITSFRLHDLQNKYFALTGKELEVKL